MSARSARPRSPLAALTVMILAFGAPTGCTKDDPPEAPPPATETAPVTAEAPPPAVELGALTLHLHPTIGSKCRVLAPKAYFPFDSAKLSWADEAVIEDVVRCLGRDDMKDAKLRLIGRASVVGPKDYNRDLAMRRAKAVGDALTAKGLDRERVELVARGEKGFDTPETKVGYAFQRRVDLQLADASPEAIEIQWWDVDADQRMGQREFYDHMVDLLTIDGFDRDGSGGLDEEETADFVLGTWDEDGDGGIEKDEWGFGARGWFAESDHLGEFETWDADGDGRIAGTEWGQAFTKSEIHETWDADGDRVVYDHELTGAIFAAFDLDDDGWLDMKEAGAVRAWRPASAEGDPPPPQ